MSASVTFRKRVDAMEWITKWLKFRTPQVIADKQPTEIMPPGRLEKSLEQRVADLEQRYEDLYFTVGALAVATILVWYLARATDDTLADLLTKETQ
ncbi:MAG TPA: hypothetical protein VK667_03695 [Ktedonobacteraceae bacterium]|nr:hypothetical protein [Ktedonobacteraceae bacterium]